MADNVGAIPPTGDQDYDGPLVNGVPVLTVERVQEWCSASHLPELTIDGATAVAQALNNAKHLTALWHPDQAHKSRSSLVAQSQRRVAEAVATLVHDLPEVVAHVRRGYPNIERFPMEELLDLVKSIEPSIKSFLPKKGREPDLANNVAMNLGKMIEEHWPESGGLAPRVRSKAKAAFVVMAMKWLDVEKTDEAIGRVRQRRTRQKAT